MKWKTALAMAFVVATASLARADTPTAAGFWEAQDDDGHPTAWFLFTDKNNVYSARLVKGFKPENDDAPPPQTICTKCPGKKKGAHIMGLTLFWGMKRDGLDYHDGSVLDPRDGSVYHAQMHLSEDGKELSVRGYVFMPMLGKTQVWRRLPDDAMKKEDIPKEILANGESPTDAQASDKPEHPKHRKAAKAAKKESQDAGDNSDSDKTDKSQ